MASSPGDSSPKNLARIGKVAGPPLIRSTPDLSQAQDAAFFRVGFLDDPHPGTAYHSRYSGFFFHPVTMEAKLFQPCRTTMMRCPRRKKRIAHITAKCQIRAQSNPPIIQDSQENCTGFHTASPVRTDKTPSPTADVYASFCS